MLPCNISINGKTFQAQICVTDLERKRGLMFCLPPVTPTVFLFDPPVVQRFWMKNTFSPLDIVFISNGIITDIVRGTPMSEDLVGPNSKSDMVLEFDYGTCKALQFKVGDKVSLQQDF